MDIIGRFYEAEREYTTLPPTATDAERAAAKEKWLGNLDDDFVLTHSPDLPWGGEWKGRQGFSDWTTATQKYIAKIDVEVHGITTNEDGTSVVVHLTGHLTTQSTGKEVDVPMVQVITVDPKKGKLLGLRPFVWNVKGLNEAIGVST